MRLPPKPIIFTGLAIVVFFIAGIYSHPWLFEKITPTLDGAIYDVTIMTSPFEQALFFALICALIPLALYFIWKLLDLRSISKKIISVILILGCMAASVVVRRYIFKNELHDITKDTPNFQFNSNVATAFENLNIEYWMLIGLIIGAMATFILFRKKRTNAKSRR